MPLKFMAEVTVKVGGIREAGESNRSIERIMAYMNQPLRQRRGTGAMPTRLCGIKGMIGNEEVKESAGYCRDFDTRLCGRLSEC